MLVPLESVYEHSPRLSPLLAWNKTKDTDAGLRRLANLTRVQAKPLDVVARRADGMNVDQHDKTSALDRRRQITRTASHAKLSDP